MRAVQTEGGWKLVIEAKTDEERLTLLIIKNKVEAGQFTIAPCHVETLQFITSRGEITSNEVATKFGLSVPAANNRMAKLLSMGLLERRREAHPSGGHFWVYKAARANKQTEI